MDVCHHYRITLLERTETDESQMAVTIIYYIGPVLRLTHR
jgi:hypothetical protein